MQTFLVGGAVRDSILRWPVKDRDYVVVGETPATMVAAGFKQVGADFPVFLHPETGEEYALARTERKIGAGYQGFEVSCDAGVTLEEDLGRRDLTINAIAQDAGGRLIDPFGGCADLAAGVLRHVSAAFAEDPVRILRVARFAARYGFLVAPETMALMREMVSVGEVDALVPERVWAETEKALGEARPSIFFEILRESGALHRVFPELASLIGVAQPAEHHPEGDAWAHTMMVLDQAARLSRDVAVRFAALVHDLGKGATRRNEWPRHSGHEARSAKIAAELAARIRVPSRVRDAAILAAAEHGRVHKAFEMKPKSAMRVFESSDVFRRPERFEALLMVAEADHRGRAGREMAEYPEAHWWRRAADAVKSVNARAIAQATADKKRVPEAIRIARIDAIRTMTAKTAAQ